MSGNPGNPSRREARRNVRRLGRPAVRLGAGGRQRIASVQLGPHWRWTEMAMPTDHYTDDDWRQIAWELRQGIHHYRENLNTAATDNWSAYLLDQLAKDIVNQADALQPLIDSMRKQGS